MSYKICENCKHWSPSIKQKINNDRDNYGNCDSGKFIHAEELTKESPTDAMTYGDYEGYSAYFETGAKFGCIHWEGK